MRQYIKYMITLAALLTVSMGAWAGDITLKQNVTNAKVKIGDTQLTASLPVKGQSDNVTLTIMPDNDANASEPTEAGYFLSNATVAARVYTTEAAQARHRAPGDTQTLPYSSLEVTKTANGTYTFTMPASGNVQLEITATASVVALTGVANAVYSTSPITPGVTIEGNAATATTDYTIAYNHSVDGADAHTNAGTVTTTLTGVGAYWGEVKKTFEIQKATITVVELAEQNFEYNSSDHTPQIQKVTTANGLEISSNFDSYFNTSGDVSQTDANTYDNENARYNTYTLTVAAKEGTNYTGSVDVGWSIVSADISIATRFKVVIGDVTYDGENKYSTGYTGSALEPSVVIYDTKNTEPTEDDEQLTKDTHYSLNYSSNTNYGTATVTLTALGNNYAGVRTETFTITKKEVTVSVTTPKQITYGTANSEIGVLTYTYSGYVGELAAFEAGLGGSVSYTTDYNSADADKRNVGKYKVTLDVSGLTHDNYSFTTESEGYADMIEVTKAPLSVTAKDHSIVYGEEPTSTGVIYSGWKYNDADNANTAVTGELTYTSPYKSTTYGDVGSYTLQAGGLTSENYNLTFTTDGVLTVTQKEVALNWSNTQLTYNSNPQAPTASVTAESIVNSDVIAVTVTGQQTNASEGYTATASALTGDKAGNYKLPAANTTTFNIGKATGSIEYTTTSVQKLFGDAVFTNSLDLEGDGTVTYESSEPNVATVDEFGAISITGDGVTTITATVRDKTDGNYHYTSTTDGEATTQYTLTVGALTIASTNTPYSNVYDGGEHTISVAVTYPENFSEGGTIQYSDDGGLNWSPTNPAKKDVGTYTIYYKLSKTGYTTVTHHSTITITPAPLTITADNKGITYGDALPAYTVTYGENNKSTNYFVGGETTDVLGGTLTYACDYTEQYQDRGTGSFTITPSGLTSSNYTITFVPGTLTVAQKNVTLTWGTTEFVCNDVDAQSPYPSFGDGEIVNGDNVIVSIAVTQGTTPVAEPVSVGEYTATASLTGTKADNYKFAEGATTVQDFSIKRQMTGVDFTSKNWVTYYASEDLALPTGITAYRVSAVNGAMVTAETVGYIKANTGVLLYKSGTPAMPLLAGSYTGTNTDYTSLLKGGNFAEGRNYILYGDNFVVYDGTATGPGEYRCYLPAEDATAAARYRSLTIVVGGDGGTTSIDGTRLTDNDNMADADWYDLQGRKLDGKPEKKGLYIMNGKKVVIK